MYAVLVLLMVSLESWRLFVWFGLVNVRFTVGFAWREVMNSL